VLIVRALAEDNEGSLWCGHSGMGLLRLLPDGRIVRYAISTVSARRPRRVADV